MNRRNIGYMLEKTWVKVVSIILAGLLVLGMGFWGVNAMLKNTSRSANSTESAKESSKEEKEEDLAWDKKLIVLMDNQNGRHGISAKELRAGQYETTPSAGSPETRSVSNITAEQMPSGAGSAELAKVVADNKAELFKLNPNLGGFVSLFYVTPDSATIFGTQNLTAEDFNQQIKEPKMSFTMTNAEMKKYYEKHEKELAPLVDKVHVDSKNKNANSKPTTKQESKPQEQKQEQAKPEKKASDLSLKEQQALALLALPAEMYSDYGEINTDMILSGVAPYSSHLNSAKETTFSGISFRVDGDKYFIKLADANMEQPATFVAGFMQLNGDTVTYKTQGTRISPTKEETQELAAQGITDMQEMIPIIADKRAQVKGTESLQALYNKYKDDPKFEQMQAKIK